MEDIEAIVDIEPKTKETIDSETTDSEMSVDKEEVDNEEVLVPSSSISRADEIQSPEITDTEMTDDEEEVEVLSSSISRADEMQSPEITDTEMTDDEEEVEVLSSSISRADEIQWLEITDDEEEIEVLPSSFSVAKEIYSPNMTENDDEEEVTVTPDRADSGTRDDKGKDSMFQNPQDEVYLSDDEPDLFNEAMQSKLDDDEEGQECVDAELQEGVEDFCPNLTIINEIQPETCLQDSKVLLRKLSLYLNQFGEKKGKSCLKMLNELGYKILEKVDKYCESSEERRQLSKSLNMFCDCVDDILTRTNECEGFEVEDIESKETPTSPQIKVFPPGPWQKLMQPKESEAKEMYQNAKKRVKKISDKMEKICIAPGEFGNFQNWGEDIFIEEKCFPHLFPYGIGGYLSTALEGKDHDMGFANYIRHRVMSSDRKYRQDYVYLFFLLLVKELIALKRCKETYLRQATQLPKMSKEDVLAAKNENLVRYNRSFEVFKTMRGTSSYYQQ